MDAKFCGDCGEKLPSANTKTCVKCGSNPFAHNSYCMSCGEKAKNKNAVACVKCGASLSASPFGNGPKDPTTALLVSVVGMFILGMPSIGYAYLGNLKKCLIYIVATWGMLIGLIIVYVVASYLTLGIGLICCLPLLLIPLAINLAIVYDVYMEAKGEKMILPDFK